MLTEHTFKWVWNICGQRAHHWLLRQKRSFKNMSVFLEGIVTQTAHSPPWPLVPLWDSAARAGWAMGPTPSSSLSSCFQSGSLMTVSLAHEKVRREDNATSFSVSTLVLSLFNYKSVFLFCFAFVLFNLGLSFLLEGWLVFSCYERLVMVFWCHF